MFIQKLKASLTHLGFSTLLVSTIMGVILYFWFPKIFRGVTDFKEVAIIVIIVDLILGPLLTFVIFQPEKKSLKFDLSVIATIQISALAYGIHSLYLIHPVFVTFNVDRFTIVKAQDMKPIKTPHKEYKVSKYGVPKLAFAQLPKDQLKRLEISIIAAKGGADIDKHIEYYEPYQDNIAKILEKSLDPELVFSNITPKEHVWLKPNNMNNYAFLPLSSVTKDVIIVLDRVTAMPITTIDLNPWKISKKN